MTLLPYEKQALMDLLTNDCLVVLAEGVYYENIMFSFLESYCNPGTLVVAIEFPEVLERWLLTKLTMSDAVTIPPKKITSDLNIDKRVESYLSGGIQFISKRILIIDLLQKRVPIDLITGLILFNAHFINDLSIESFIARLYRTENNSGFIKAFSTNPICLNQNNQLEKSLKYLFLPKFHLWPRFHVNISESIEKHKCDVVELHIPLTESMKNLQLCIIDLLHFCLKELKKCIPSLQSDFLVVENAISKNYFRILKKQLKITWSTLGENTKQLVQDVKTISELNNQLVQHNAVQFYKNVQRLRPAVSFKNSRVSLWMFTEAFEKLLDISKRRVQMGNKNSGSIELSGKWQAIQEVLSEINDDCKESSDYIAKTILFCVPSLSIAKQLVQFIKYGEIITLKGVMNHNNKATEYNGEHEDTDAEDVIDEHGIIKLGLEMSDNIHFLILTQNIIMDEFLSRIEPTFIIMYDPNLLLIRSFEMYRCRRPGKLLRIYFLVYDNSIEEQRYLTHISKEKKSFEDLIMLKGNITIHADQDGKQGLNPLLGRGKQSLKFTDLSTQDRRKGELQKQNFQKIIVDMRDFRSSLPSILHKTGLDLIPKTIEIGDYILTPDICIERKSIPDLISSLTSGRLYQQCQAMCRTYKHPMLLIEFEESNGFSLQNYSAVSDAVVLNSIQTQLSLITLHFNNLKMIWSESEYTTADIFHELKKGKHDPTIEGVNNVSKDKSIHSSEFNHHIMDVLLSLPGITSKNYFLVARKFRNISDLSNASQCDLEKVFETKSDAKKLFEFFNQKETDNKTQSDIYKQPAKNKYAKFKRFKK